MGLTTDRHDGCLHEIDEGTGMQKCYLILPDGQRKNLVAPVRRSYTHMLCGGVTTMARELAETYAAQPEFYGGTYCARCRTHFKFGGPDGGSGDFRWLDENTRVGDPPESKVERSL